MTDPIKDERQLWEQLPDEPNRLFDRFERFREMGPDRSVYRLYVQAKAARRDVSKDTKKNAKPSNCPPSWRKTAEKWNWYKRAEAWDASEREKDRKEWEAYRKELRDKERSLARELAKKVEDMLMYPTGKPIREETIIDGKVVAVTTINPADWSFKDIGKLLETVSKVGRLAAGMATNIEEHREKTKTAEEMTDDELAAIAAGDTNPTASGTDTDKPS